MEWYDVKRWYDLALLALAILAVFAMLLVPLVRDLRQDLRERRANRAEQRECEDAIRRAFGLACELFETTEWVQVMVSRVGDDYVAAAIHRHSGLVVCGQVPMSSGRGALESLCLALTKKLQRVEDEADAQPERSA